MASPEVISITNTIAKTKLQSLRANSRFTDITFVCAGNEWVHAHRAVVCEYSSYVLMLSESEGKNVVIDLSKLGLDVRKELMSLTVDFMYGMDLTIALSDLSTLMVLANRLNMLEFISAIDCAISSPTPSEPHEQTQWQTNETVTTADQTNIKIEAKDVDFNEQYEYGMETTDTTDVNMDNYQHLNSLLSTPKEALDLPAKVETIERLKQSVTPPVTNKRKRVQPRQIVEAPLQESRSGRKIKPVPRMDQDDVDDDDDDEEPGLGESHEATSRVAATTWYILPNQPSQANKRFKNVSESDLKAREDSRHEQKTKRQTQWAIKIFQDWLCETENESKVLDKELIESEDFPKLMRKFYGSVVKQNGTSYLKASLINLRAGIQRHIYDLGANVYLMSDQFKLANRQLSAVIKELKRQGLEDIRHKEGFEPDDFKKLYSSDIVFSNDDPKKLQNKVFFELMFHMGPKGRDYLRELKKTSFNIKKDGHGVEYIEMANEKKNKTPVIEATGTKNCPVTSFKLYMSKLNPECDDFFQVPLNGIHQVFSETSIWYCRAAMGVNTLSNMMKTISERAMLSRTYTNRCIRPSSQRTRAWYLILTL